MSNQSYSLISLLCLNLLLLGSAFELCAQEAGLGEERDSNLQEMADWWEEFEAHLLEREEQIERDLEEWEEDH